MLVRRNFSSRAGQLSGGDALLISIPNSGRTWIRTFLAAYFCRRYQHSFSLDPDQYRDPRVPRVTYTHDLYEHHTKSRLWDRLRGKYLAPPAALRGARILLLARDPRDAFVSHYVELTRRTHETAEELKKRSVSEMLRDRIFGIRLMIQTMNNWLAEFGARATLLRYEDLQTEPGKEFRRLLAAVGETEPDEKVFAAALEFAQFGNMKKMEASRQYDRQLLQPGDVSDPESYKVRRGKVGGFVEHFTPQDLDYARRAMQALDRRFGYRA
ncbi:MAG TPA: sulfotransferase domain-containing protein [Chthoniobacterales bacterium]|jgi:hypothetical protein